MKLPKIDVKLVERPVETLRDLADLVSDNTMIFSDAINCVSKQVKKMKGKIGILTLGVIIGAAYNAYQHRQMDEQIYNLQIRVKKLENPEEMENSEEE